MLRRALCRRRLAVAGLSVVALVVLAVLFLPGALSDALTNLEAADRRWLLFALACFLCSAVASAGIWHEGLSAAGRTGTFGDGCARYAVGSLVNSFSPGRLGELVRVALFAQTVPEEGRAWATGGGLAAVFAARSVALSAVLVAAVSVGAVPLWIVGVVVAIGGTAVLLALAARSRAPQARLDHLLAAFRELGRDPHRSARLIAWALAAAATRVVALAAVAASLGVPSAFVVALIVLPALDLAGTVAITPGNLGIGSGLTAVALASYGIGLPLGLSVGIAVHAAETAVGICFGLGGALALAPIPAPARRRIALSASAAASAAVVAAFALTMFPGLV